MVLRIDQDHARFRRIVRGAVRENLREYITKGELIGRRGKDHVSIPLPQIELPRFKYGSHDRGGVGQGEGDIGDSLGGDEQAAPGQGEAGDQPGEHVLEVEVSLDELAEILGEELELPNIEARGKKNVIARKDRYSGIRPVGPESLRHFKRTYKQALKRLIAAGEYDPRKPNIVPIREDRRYRSWKVIEEPEHNAVIIYMMDVSGSMGEEQKEIVRMEAFWIDTWLRHQYKKLESRFIIHDAVAREVDEHAFYHTRESGGTKISSAYDLCASIMADDFPTDEWNIYPFHFSDGDNWGADDTTRCIERLRSDMLPACNQFCYGQVRSVYGSGKFKGELDSAFEEEPKLVTSDIPDREGILQSIRAFLGKGQ